MRFILQLLAMGAAGLTLALSSSPARACSMEYVDLFAQADGATSIAVGRWAGSGVRVERAIRPHQTPVRSVRVRLGNTSCDPRPRAGERLLVLVDGGDRLVAHYQSAIVLDDATAEAAMVDALRRWHALALAPDPARQRTLLVELATHGAGRVARDAAWHLAASAALVRGTTDDERTALVAAVAGARDERATALAMVLARLHARDAIPALVAQLESASTPEDFAAALELLTGHHEPPFVHGRTLDGSQRALAARWRAWSTHGRVAVQSGDAHALAASICGAPDELTRIAATEACERAHGRTLGYGFWFWTQGVAGAYWATLAGQCEHGPPPPDGAGYVAPPAPICAPPADAPD